VRPVNLIPPEERRGEKTPLRAGPLSYVVVGVLAIALAAVTAIVLMGNTISDREAEVSSLKSEVAAAKAQAKRLSAFTDFAAMQDARQETVTSLATSRFDWERVLREISLVIPDDVWLTNFTATASGSASEGASSSATSSSSSDVAMGITGPTLDIQGCAAGHEAVAKFLAALREVDGVTRVSVLSSERPDGVDSASSASTPGGEDSAVACSTRDFISTFDVIAAFDAAQPVAPTDASAEPPTDASGAETTTTTTSDEGGDTQPAESGDATSAVVSGTGSAP
jgi:Tfp pilus assembly protein PilN